jgi:hypothetical protein
MRLHPLARALFGLALASAIGLHQARAQQTIRRYDAYVGFADLNAPDLGLNQPGFHAQAGINMRRWLSVGGDYTVASGGEILTTSLLPAALQAQVNGAQQQFTFLGLLPANYRLAVPTDAATQTFAFGPQLAYRHFSKVTLFLRPSLGALRERAVPHARDAFQQVVVAQLAPAGFKRDWTGFYGAGGGAELALTQRLGLRAQMDAVYNHPFNDILANGRWTYRSSIGLAVHFGHEIAGSKGK